MTYIDTPPQLRRWGCIYTGHYWGAVLHDRLTWQYGHEQARRIRAGHDAATNADIAAWQRLGERGGA